MTARINDIDVFLDVGFFGSLCFYQFKKLIKNEMRNK